MTGPNRYTVSRLRYSVLARAEHVQTGDDMYWRRAAGPFLTADEADAYVRRWAGHNGEHYIVLEEGDEPCSP